MILKGRGRDVRSRSRSVKSSVMVNRAVTFEIDIVSNMKRQSIHETVSILDVSDSQLAHVVNHKRWTGPP